jgi:hypothetical protein
MEVANEEKKEVEQFINIKVVGGHLDINVSGVTLIVAQILLNDATGMLQQELIKQSQMRIVPAAEAVAMKAFKGRA